MVAYTRYDKRGRKCRQIVDHQGNVSEYIYDAQGRLQKKIDNHPLTTCEVNKHKQEKSLNRRPRQVVEYDYNDINCLVRISKGPLTHVLFYHKDISLLTHVARKTLSRKSGKSIKF